MNDLQSIRAREGRVVSGRITQVQAQQLHAEDQPPALKMVAARFYGGHAGEAEQRVLNR